MSPVLAAFRNSIAGPSLVGRSRNSSTFEKFSKSMSDVLFLFFGFLLDAERAGGIPPDISHST